MATNTATSGGDERVAQSSWIQQLLTRPELGAAGGVIVVWAFFAIIAGDSGFLSLRGAATYLEVSAELGILAIAVALLMIAGEFDLSIGSMIGATSMTMAILSGQFGVSVWISMFLALVLALVVGYLNGYVVIKTNLPSFIVTLASLFIIRGATIGFSRLITGRTQIGNVDEAPGFLLAEAIFASEVQIGAAGFPISIAWWLGLAALATWVLLRTPQGNWIFGIGGDANAARNVGVPVNNMKIALFMTTAVAAWLVAVIQLTSFTGADVLRGEIREFFAIIAVVIGGTLLTGGYGSAIGAVFGALIFGMVRQGIVFAGVDADWFQVFLGGMLLVAVLINNYVRKRASEVKR